MKELARAIAEHTKMTQAQARELLQRVLDGITDRLVNEGYIRLGHFGTFEVKQRKARKARNPRTGEKVDVPPKCVVTFKPGKEMEERVRQLEVKNLSAEKEAHAREDNGVREGSALGDGAKPAKGRSRAAAQPVPSE